MQNTLLCPYCKNILHTEEDGYFCAKCSSVYPVMENGIISFAKNLSKNINFDEDLCNTLFEMEKKHCWHVGRKEIIYGMLEMFMDDNAKNTRMLEIGCGNGNVLQYLKKKGINIEGSDISFSGLNLCSKRVNVPLYQLDTGSPFLPFSSESYDTIGMFDLIEHVDNDQHLLEEAFRCCKRNGLLIITVPANKYLWSYFDDVAGHKRRYSKKEIEKKLQKAGFEIKKISFYVFFLFPIIFLIRKLRSIYNCKKNKQVNNLIEIQTIPMLNSFFLALMRLEKKMLPFINFPWGASLIMVAKKNNNSKL